MKTSRLALFGGSLAVACSLNAGYPAFAQTTDNAGGANTSEPAAGQDQAPPPESSGPPGGAAGGVQQQDLPPAGAATPSPGNTAPAMHSYAAPTDIAVSQLGTVDGPVAGTLDDSNGGLGAQMWSGTPRAELEDELSRIPIVTTDPVVRDLARRLLLTRADAPNGSSHHALATTRIARLLDGGLIDQAGEIASQSEVPHDLEFARVQAEALLYAGSTEVCSDKTNARLSESDVFWLQLRAYCYSAGGDAASADLTRSVMDAQGESDGGFSTLLDDVMSAKASPPGQFQHPTAVDIFLLHKLGLPVTTAVASQLGTPASVIALRDPRNSAVERLSAAEHILLTGAASGSELSAIADEQVYPDALKADPASGGAMPFLMRQSLVRQSLALETRPAAKIRLLERADPTQGEEGPFHVFAELQAPQLATTPPLPGSGRGAWIAARTLMLGGEPRLASGWLGTPDNPLTAQAALANDLMTPGPAEDARAQKAIAWFSAHQTIDTGGWPAAAALSLGIARAFGMVPPETVTTPPPQTDAPTAPAAPPPIFDGATLDPDTMQKIDAAASDPSRRGEAVLLLINAIGTRGPARFAPDADIYFVRILKKLRLNEDARKLAAECLLLGPPPPAKRPALAPSPAAGS